MIRDMIRVIDEMQRKRNETPEDVDTYILADLDDAALDKVRSFVESFEHTYFTLPWSLVSDELLATLIEGLPVDSHAANSARIALQSVQLDRALQARYEAINQELAP